MKKLILIGVLLVSVITTVITSCQRDDICAETDSTTPRLIIKFQDFETPDEDKSVSNLRVLAEGIDTPLPGLSASTTDSIAVPLRSFSPETTFIMISDYDIDSGGNETGNRDTLRFDYITKEVFVSRACGFVANYETLVSTLTSDDANWIKAVTVNTAIVNNETQTHVTILH
jgi:hypothetical protein